MKIESKRQVLIVSMAAILSVLCFWKLWEQDLFWQIRDGLEILKHGHLPRTETWSYSASGPAWLNFEWLTCVIMASVQLLLGFKVFIVMRAAAGFLISILVGRLVEIKSHVEPKTFSLLILVPLSFLAMNFRLQMRPELFIIALFCVQQLILSGEGSEKQKIGICFALQVLAANLHSGSAPFLIFGFIFLFAMRINDLKKAVLLSVVSLVTLFLTPYSVGILPVLWHHINYSAVTLLENPDHAPIGLAHFDPYSFGFTGYAWIILNSLAMSGYFKNLRKTTARMTRGLWLEFGGFLLLTIACLSRDRVIPFAILYGLTRAVEGLELSLMRFKGKRGADQAGLRFLLVGLIWLIMVPFALAHPLLPLGYDFNRHIYAIGSAEFIKRVHPEPNIFHQPSEGNLIHGFLPEYKVLIDPREATFTDVQRELALAWDAHSPKILQGLFTKYDIRTIWLPTHTIALNPQGGLRDSIREYFPDKDWALVHFDLRTMVLLKRTAAHREMIRENEFKLLRPNLPHNFYFSQKRTADTDAQFQMEVSRCLATEPEQPHCWAARASILRTQQKSDEYQAMLNKLEELYSQNRDSTSIMIELDHYYELLGRTKDQKNIEDEIKFRNRT